MKTNQKDFNAIGTLMEISRMLENSRAKFVSLYSEEMKKIQMKDKDQPELAFEDEKHLMEEEVQQLGTFMKTDSLETLMFVAVYSVQTMRSCSVDCCDISRFIGLNNMDFLPLKKYVVSLYQKGLLRENNRHRENEYRVSNAAERALFDNKPFKAKKIEKIDRYKFCHNISALIEDRSQDNIQTEELFDLVQVEEEQQKKLPFVKQIRKLLLSIEDRTLFYEICDDFINDRRHVNSGLECTLDDIYDNMHRKLFVAKDIMNKKHAVIVSGLVELQPSQFVGNAELSLTEKGRHILLEEDFELFSMKGGSDCRLLSPDKIPNRELFFSDELLRDINFVKQSLQEDSFMALQKRLEENALPKGVAILLHGLPGTGKTAVAEMLAKTTGRSVYHVDIAASKTCWFGESEKLFKRIFTDYRRMCETEKLKPILLFNEADALFSKRRDVNSGNCAQTENALQNILLEEMEKLDGILIATTNLCDNFDSAFERRFLFKIKFGKPTAEAKKSIWKSKLAWLTDDNCGKLAAQYDLSGGEIDNIVRKALMEEVLNGQRPTMETLAAWCRGEKLNAGKSAAIGFNK